MVLLFSSSTSDLMFYLHTNLRWQCKKWSLFFCMKFSVAIDKHRTERKKHFNKSANYSRHCPDLDYGARLSLPLARLIQQKFFYSHRVLLMHLHYGNRNRHHNQHRFLFHVAPSKRKHRTAFILTDRLSRNCAYSIVFVALYSYYLYYNHNIAIHSE